MLAACPDFVAHEQSILPIIKLCHLWTLGETERLGRLMDAGVDDLGLALIFARWAQFLGIPVQRIMASASAHFSLLPGLPLSTEKWFFHGDPQLPHRSSLPFPLADTMPNAWGRHLLRKAQSGSETVFFGLRKHGRLLEEIGLDR